MSRASGCNPELEPIDLIAKSTLVGRVGRLALSAGHGSYRVKSHMQRVGTALGLDEVSSNVTLTQLTATSKCGPIFRTQVMENRAIAVNADRLSELEKYIASLPAQASVEQISAGIDRIVSRRPIYPRWVHAVSAGFACAAFAFLSGGGPIECAMVLVAAALGQFTQGSLLRRGLNHLGVTMLAAAVVSLIYLGLVAVVESALTSPGQFVAGYVAAVLFLVPGFPLVTGSLDLARLDLNAGISRVTYALLVLGSAALALWVVSTALGVAPDPMDSLTLAPHLWWSLRVVASFIAVLGFAFIFNSPPRMAAGAAVIGTVANMARLVLLDVVHWSPQISAAMAALLVGLLARALAPRLGVPRLTVSVPAVVIMVPGLWAYQAVFEFNEGNVVDALSFSVQAALVVISLAGGLAVARMLTDRDWAFDD